MKAAFASVLKDMPQATLSVLELHSFTGGQQLAAVDTAASAALGARCQVWSDFDAFSRVCQEQGPTWAQKRARVLIMLNWDGLHTADAPADSLVSRPTGTGGQSVSGMHAIMDVLARLGSLISAEHMGVLVFHRSEASDADVECLNKILGPSQSLSSELYAVPQSPWTVHATLRLGKIGGHSESLRQPIQMDGCNVSCDSRLSDGSPGAVVVGHTFVGSSARRSPNRWCATGVFPGRVPRSTFRSRNLNQNPDPKLLACTVRGHSVGDALWFRFWARLAALNACPTLGSLPFPYHVLTNCYMCTRIENKV